MSEIIALFIGAIWLLAVIYLTASYLFSRGKDYSVPQCFGNIEDHKKCKACRYDSECLDVIDYLNRNLN